MLLSNSVDGVKGIFRHNLWLHYLPEPGVLASRNHYFIAKSDILFLGRLDCRFLSLMITLVIVCTLPSSVCFTDSHLSHRSSDVVDGRKYFSKHILSSGMVFLLSGVSVLNILNWSTTLLLQYAP
jgi:hypothetical protein